MIFSYKKNIFLIAFIVLVNCLNAQKINFNLLQKKDSSNIYREMFNDKSDDLMEDFPADDLYSNIWTSARINPYRVPLDSIRDSIVFDCTHFVKPVKGGITSNFGPRWYRFHYGTDLQVAIGDTVRAAFSGKVRIIEYEARGYGNYVVIRHDNGLETVYGHLSAVLVNLNQSVRAGEVIAYGGNTGRSTGPHLHFEVRYLGYAFNPSDMIDFTTGKVRSKKFLLTKRQAFYYKKEPATPVNNPRYYAVRKGDTLSKIAARNGVSLKSLAKLNGLSTSSKVKPGEQLRVR